MKKFGVWAGTVFITIIIAGIYGILNDQITFSISKEYFTKFKYLQFGFEPAWFGGDRKTVAVIGFLATWWVGLLMGIVVASVGLFFKDPLKMKRSVMKAVMIIFITAILFGFMGFAWGKYYLLKAGVNWWLPDDLIDKNDYIIVGSIHNFSYLGGAVGLLIALVYLIKKIRGSKESAAGQ
jgi:hypothetical protein